MKSIDELIQEEAKNYSYPMTAEGVVLLVHNIAQRHAIEFGEHLLSEYKEAVETQNDKWEWYDGFLGTFTTEQAYEKATKPNQ